MLNDMNEFQGLMDNLHIGVCRTSFSPNAKFLYTNAEFFKIFGFHCGGKKQAYLSTLFLSDSEYTSFLGQLRSLGYLNNLEIRLRNKKKKFIWCSVSATLDKGAETDKYFIDITVEDITKRKEFEKNLIEFLKVFQLLDLEELLQIAWRLAQQVQ